MVAKFWQFCGLSLLLTGCSSLKTYVPDWSASALAPPVVNTAPKNTLPATVHQIALLLPAQGGLTNAANAIEAGFTDAYPTTTNKPIIKNYDTSQISSMQVLYSQAINDGADRVVGPLTKENVANLAQNFPGKTFTLALNSLENMPTVPAYFYQFSLSPTDEAQQVADKASNDGYHAALLITPAGKWGENIARLLMQRFQQDGGIIVASTSLGAKTNVAAQITHLLKATSVQRRQDFDVVFMIVQPLFARQIKPLLKYYHAAQVPVYSTSLVYSGVLNSAQDHDLDGVKFCDMPLVIDQQGPWAQVRQNFTLSRSGDMQNYVRLYGLGWDAALIMQNTHQLMHGGLQGATGYLYTDPQQHILRKLPWAIFQQGVPVPIN